MSEVVLSDLQLAARMMREAVKDKSYRAFPLGGEAGKYLRHARGHLTAESYRDYEACLDKFVRFFVDLELSDFEPPVGSRRLEEFLDHQWGERAPRTYNKNLSIIKALFKFHVLRGDLHGDPALSLTPHKKRDVHREIFSTSIRKRILADGPSDESLRRDRLALHLLLDYGLRKGALQRVQFKHFDHSRKRLTVFTKGAKIRDLPIPDPAFWEDLSKLQLELWADPGHYLLPRERNIWRGYNPDGSSRFERKAQPDKPKGAHGAHDWWYGCLQRAGIVPQGTTSGEKMHKARHTAGQRVLDKTGNLKAAQKLLGHADIGTTANVYVDWDIDALTKTMQEVLRDDDE